jgi:hypothetical protein
MKVLQTSRAFFAGAFENIRKFKKVALPADYLGCADLCGSPHLLTLMTASSLDDATPASPAGFQFA